MDADAVELWRRIGNGYDALRLDGLQVQASLVGATDSQIKRVFSIFAPYETDLVQQWQTLHRLFAARAGAAGTDLAEAGAQWVNEVARSAEALGISALVEQCHMTVTTVSERDDRLLQSSSEWFHEWQVHVNDRDVGSSASDGMAGYYSLKEAFWGLVHSHTLVWFLLEPMVDWQVNSRLYVDVLAAGGDVQITDRGPFIVTSESK